jgi:hypothetical protein
MRDAWVCCAWSKYRCSAIAEFSAAYASVLPLNSLAPNPLKNVRRAIAQLDVVILAIAQEPNGLQIDKVYLGQIEDHAARSILDALPEFLDAVVPDPPD